MHIVQATRRFAAATKHRPAPDREQLTVFAQDSAGNTLYRVTLNVKTGDAWARKCAGSPAWRKYKGARQRAITTWCNLVKAMYPEAQRWGASFEGNTADKVTYHESANHVHHWNGRMVGDRLHYRCDCGAFRHE